MELERLQKYISRCGYVSRRKAEELIVAGKVQVNGRLVTELGTKINPNVDRVKIDGQRLEVEKLVYYVLNKPKGSITSVGDPQGRDTVMDYLKDVKQRVYPVGRLDYNTEGLLLFTNDGALAQALMHPSKGVNKTYEVKLKGRVADEHLEGISKGVDLEDGMTSPADIVDYGFDSKTNLTTVEITIHEGRNRQVRRMFEYYHYSVHNLKRIAYGGITLAGLKRGAYRNLTDEEIRQLKGLVDLPTGKGRSGASARSERSGANKLAGGKGRNGRSAGSTQSSRRSSGSRSNRAGSTAQLGRRNGDTRSNRAGDTAQSRRQTSGTRSNRTGGKTLSSSRTNGTRSGRSTTSMPRKGGQ